MRPSARRTFVIVVTACSLAAVSCGNSDGESSSTTARPPATPTSSSTTTTEADTSSSSMPATPDEQPNDAIWPFASGTVRYDEPTDAAKSFVSEYLDFGEPIIEAFQQGDSRSGEVPVRSFDGGPVTTVLVRQLSDDDSWWVIGATTENITIENPEALATVASPLEVSGQSTAFEGTVNIEVREDGRMDPLAEGFATGGANGEMGPYSTSLDLAEGGAAAGAVIVKTISAKDGKTDEAAVVRVRFS